MIGLFMLIGILSNRVITQSDSDYTLAGRNVSALLTALSAAATKYSGYMFIGLIGYIYSHGLSAIWLAVGFLFGDLIAFSFVHQKVRDATNATGALSFPDLLSRWGGDDYRLLKVLIAVLILVFLTTYAAAQFNSGGKALHVLFGWHYNAGALIGALVVLIYCLYGVWTDACQSIIMMLAMLLLLIAAVQGAGGITNFIATLSKVSPSYMDLGTERFGSVGALALFAFGWLFNGIGVTGQPQVMVRFMALDASQNTVKTGVIYFLWSSVFLILTFLVGLATRLYIDNATSFDAELALPTLAGVLLPEILVGIVIAGVFAASMSTADSQVLSCSAVLSDDLKLGRSNRVRRFSTLLISIVALTIAIFVSANVFTLVIFAWSALACSIGPIVIIYALGNRPPQWLAVTTMLVGLFIALLWRELQLTDYTYEGFPGIVGALIVYYLLNKACRMTGKSRAGLTH